jgi:hypothetical protein
MNRTAKSNDRELHRVRRGRTNTEGAREIETGRREDGCRPGIAEGRTRAGTAGELKETVKLVKR